MVPVRGRVFVVVAAATFAAAGAAAAQPKPSPSRPAAAPLVGATEVLAVTAPSGFLDDAVASDGARFAYVVADGSTRAELHVVTLPAGGAPAQVIDLSPIALYPISVDLVGPARAFVVGRLDDGRASAALIELADKGKARPAGTPVYKVPAAAHITVLPRGVAVHRTSSTAGGGTRHEVELLALDTGRRIAGPRGFDVDASSTHKPLDLRINHWSEGWTRAHGIQGGAWDPKENQRTPDREATYDLLAGKLVDPQPIVDLFDQRRRFQILAAEATRVDFLRISPDGASIQLWRAGKPRALELDQPVAAYNPKSIQGVVRPDGSGWLAVQVDPVNPDAVARQKADPEYLDVFTFTADAKATRKARVLAPGLRLRFGVLGDRFWLLERNHGFDRGGKRLALYQLP